MRRALSLTAGLALTGLAVHAAALGRHYPVTAGRESRFADHLAAALVQWAADHDPAGVQP